jgi:hypothetical protein
LRAGAITYIRNTWGNPGPAVEEKVIRQVHLSTPDRLYPKTEAELKDPKPMKTISNTRSPRTIVDGNTISGRTSLRNTSSDKKLIT